MVAVQKEDLIAIPYAIVQSERVDLFLSGRLRRRSKRTSIRWSRLNESCRNSYVHHHSVEHESIVDIGQELQLVRMNQPSVAS